ncbi:MAG: chaperone modulator CbpM [Chitinophagales bacterium]|nr:chaperone modulator CbpM [Chitinophagales bacterium]
MSTKNFIPLDELCSHYQVEMSFFSDLHEIGLIEVVTIKKTLYIHQDKITDVEKIVRLYHELEINMVGIDVVLNLLEKLSSKETEISSLKNKLRFYEH